MKKYILIFFVLEVLLFLTNYEKDTYFLGWDNLFPQADFALNIKRSIYSIWQEYRGLGLLDGMSYAANLPHYIFLYIMAHFLPQNLLRYFFFFLMHFIGGIGVYKLCNKLFVNKNFKEIASFLAGLIYLFNLGTVQMFYAPYELFAVHFAFLPWLILYTIKSLHNFSKKNIIIFSVLSICSIPQAHVPTIFLVYLFAISIILILNFSKKAFVLLLLTLVINSYWLLPYTYSAVQNAKTISESKINQMSTEDIYLRNKAFGDLKNVVMLKGFMMDYKDLQTGNLPMMKEWETHTKNPLFIFTSLGIFLLSLVGLIKTLLTKQKHTIPFAIIFISTFVLLANNTPVIKLIPDLLYNNVPFFQQIFRFTFTKFSILFVFALSILAGYGFITLYELVRFNKRIIVCINSAFLILFLLVYSWPSWQGFFLYPGLKVKIPNEYFQTLNYFKSQDPNTRISTLPQASYWGWTYKNWGYHGSGFIWYGIPQATLDGAFYPWSRENENYYWELSQALYSKNLPLLESILEKYQINWIIFDQNEINPPSYKALLMTETKDILANSGKITLAEKFNNILIYKVSLDTPIKNFLFTTSDLSNIQPTYKWGSQDTAFYQNMHYTTNAGKPDKYYPFRSLFTGRSQSEKEFAIVETENSFIFKKTLPPEISSLTLKIPDTGSKDLPLVDINNLSNSSYLSPEVNLVGNELSVIIPKITGYYTINSVMPHNLSYLISVESQNIKGKSSLFWLENLNLRRADIESYLPKSKNMTKSYFIQPPMDKDGIGYSVHLDSISIGSEISQNNIGKITINPIPYYFLTELVFQNENQPKSITLGSFNSTHPNPSVYEVETAGIQNNSIIILSQGFQRGWKAYNVPKSTKWLLAPFVGKEIKTQELVNNWQNGWKIEKVEKNTKIVIIFLPQYLQYLGFLLLPLPLIYIALRK